MRKNEIFGGAMVELPAWFGIEFHLIWGKLSGFWDQITQKSGKTELFFVPNEIFQEGRFVGMWPRWTSRIAMGLNLLAFSPRFMANEWFVGSNHSKSWPGGEANVPIENFTEGTFVKMWPRWAFGIAMVHHPQCISCEFGLKSPRFMANELSRVWPRSQRKGRRQPNHDLWWITQLRG